MALFRVSLLLVAAFVLAAVFAPQEAFAKKKKSASADCEVCIKVLEGVHASLSPADFKDVTKIESKITKYCKDKARTGTETKLCYYIEPIRREISQPFQNKVPVDRVCARLKKKSAEVCNVREAVKIDKNMDYDKLRVKALKKVLRDRGVTCEGCLEKTDFVKRCKETEHMEL